jgi:hypothetical protein
MERVKSAVRRCAVYRNRILTRYIRNSGLPHARRKPAPNGATHFAHLKGYRFRSAVLTSSRASTNSVALSPKFNSSIVRPRISSRE